MNMTTDSRKGSAKRWKPEPSDAMELVAGVWEALVCLGHLHQGSLLDTGQGACHLFIWFHTKSLKTPKQPPCKCSAGRGVGHTGCLCVQGRGGMEAMPRAMQI